MVKGATVEVIAASLGSCTSKAFERGVLVQFSKTAFAMSRSDRDPPFQAQKSHRRRLM